MFSLVILTAATKYNMHTLIYIIDAHIYIREHHKVPSNCKHTFVTNVKKTRTEQTKNNRQFYINIYKLGGAYKL